MKGLILKDFINLKKNIKLFGIFIIIYGIMAYVSEDANLFSTVFTILFAILTLTLYSYDEMAKWDAYALTMPVTRDHIVMGKYLMMILLTSIGVVTGILFSIAIYLTAAIDTPLPAIISCLLGASVAIVFYSIIMPIITNMGVEKARIILLSVYIIPFFIAVMVGKAINNNSLQIPELVADILSISVKYAYVIIPVILIIFLSISYTISVNIYRKKEF